jgi:hypothetical protein
MTTFGRTWIAVLGNPRVRFLRREPPGSWIEAAPDIALDADGGATPEGRRAAREMLLRSATAALDGACERNQCDRIVVVAPERLLRGFRKIATDRVRVRLWRERAGEVDSLSDAEIGTSVEAYFRSGVD